MGKIEIKKIERTDANVDNSSYEMKVPYEISDVYGNKATLYRKDIINKEQLLKQKEELENQLVSINKTLGSLDKDEAIDVQPVEIIKEK